jgi:hypothetical protein
MMRLLIPKVFAILTGIILIALTAAPRAAGTTDEKEVLGVVRTLVDAMREPSVPKVKAVLHENYRAESWQRSEKERFVFLESRDHLLGQIANLHPGEWDIHFLHERVNIDPNGLAVVWARYVFYSDGKPDHCGYESYTLLLTPEGWKVINFADTDTPLRGRGVDVVCRRGSTRSGK